MKNLKGIRAVVAKVVASVMDKTARIKKHPNKDEWTVYSEKGRRMGTYDSIGAAKKRLGQIEYFKHHKINDILEPNFHGEKPSFLEVEIKEASCGLNTENKMKNNLYKLAKELKMIDRDEEAGDIMDLAKSVQTSSSDTEFIKDIEGMGTYDSPSRLSEKSAQDSLTVMLAYLRAMQAWFHGAHHVTGGEGFAGDHVNLYAKIYEAIIEDYDGAAEKAVGLADESLACPIKVMDNANKIISNYKSPCDLSAVEIARQGYMIIVNYLRFLDSIYESLDKSGDLTLGLDDFIMAMANSYETFAYLLKQRSSDYKSGNKKSKV